MRDDDFEDLVRKLEAQERASPRAYRLKVALLGAAGFAYVLGVLAVMLALTLACVLSIASGSVALLKLAIVFGILAWVTLRALWVRLHPPQGRRLTRAEAPALFELVDGLRRSQGAPRVDVALLVPEFNAAIVQHPRLGPFGWYRNYLLVGMPLLLALTKEEVTAVVAHEMGHLSGAHGRFGAWTYRVRETWMRLAQSIEQTGRGSIIFGVFLRWFLPRFMARSFVLARAQEHEADRLSVQACGPRASADALARVRLADRFLDERYWAPLRAEVERSASPPERGPMAGMMPVLREPLPAEASAWLEQALTEVTTTADTHPCLADRLAAVGAAPRVPPAAQRSAAEELLGDALPGLVAELDDAWRRDVGERWTEMHAQASGARAEADALLKQEREGALEPEAAARLAELTESLDGGAAALARWRELLRREPAHADAAFHVGRLLLAEGSTDGLSFLERASGASRAHRLASARIMHAWHERHGDRDAARRQAEVLDRADEEWAAAIRERDDVPKDGADLRAADVPADAAAAIAERLQALPPVRRAWMLRRDVKLVPEVPSHVLVVERKHGFFTLESQSRDRELIQALLQIPADGTLTVVLADGPRKNLLRRAREIAPPIFERA